MRNLMPVKHHFWALILLEILVINKNTEALQYGTRVEDFIKQFTSLFNQYPLSYRENDLDTQYLNTIKQHFPNIPDSYEPPKEKPHASGYGFSPGSSLRPRPPSYLSTNDIGPNPSPGSFPLYPQRPLLHPPPLGAYPQTSLITSLGSIAKYDDLHCVPRLLCEVTSGSIINGGNKKGKEDASPVPFLSREAVIALLTVLNFVDDSPILLFLRAAFLGYSSKGDAQICLNGYPLCPKDPDQLVNYLNNHNGGFFRFFNQKLQQSYYSPHVKKYLNDTENTKKVRDFKFSPRVPKFGFASRILNDPIEIEEISNLGKIANTRLPAPNVEDDKMIFLSQYQSQSNLAYDNNEYSSVFPSRDGRKISFPGKGTKTFTANVMIFPDRTGTGNLILTGDPSVGLKITFAEDTHENGKSKIKFLRDNERYSKKMRFPVDED